MFLPVVVLSTATRVLRLVLAVSRDLLVIEAADAATALMFLCSRFPVCDWRTRQAEKSCSCNLTSS